MRCNHHQVCGISKKKLEMTSDPSTSSEQAVFIDERSRPRTFSCTERIGYCILGANTRAQLPLRHRRWPPCRKPRVIKIYSLESKNKFCLVPRSSSFGLPFCCSLLLTVARRRQCLRLLHLLRRFHSFCAASITHFVASSQFCSAAARCSSFPASARSLTTFYWHDRYPNSLSHTTPSVDTSVGLCASGAR